MFLEGIYSKSKYKREFENTDIHIYMSTNTHPPDMCPNGSSCYIVISLIQFKIGTVWSGLSVGPLYRSIPSFPLPLPVQYLQTPWADCQEDIHIDLSTEEASIQSNVVCTVWVETSFALPKGFILVRSFCNFLLAQVVTWWFNSDAE